MECCVEKTPYEKTKEENNMSDTKLEQVFISNSGILMAYGPCKGFVETVENLPTTDIEINDVYSVLEEDGAYYYYDGSSWNKCGGVMVLGGSGGDTNYDLDGGTP